MIKKSDIQIFWRPFTKGDLKRMKEFIIENGLDSQYAKKVMKSLKAEEKRRLQSVN